MSDAVNILLFAAARETVGASEVTLSMPLPATAAGVLNALCTKYPALRPYEPSLRVAINGAYARADEVVVGGDEVAIIPPVSGG